MIELVKAMVYYSNKFSKEMEKDDRFLLNERFFGRNFLKNDIFFTEQTIFSYRNLKNDISYLTNNFTERTILY